MEMRLIILFSIISLSVSEQLDTYKEFLIFSVENHYKTVSDYAKHNGLTDFDQQWEQFKLKFNRKYDPKEEDERKFNFLKSIQYIESHNKLFQSGKVTHDVGINEFADWSSDEYKSLLSSTSIPNNYEIKLLTTEKTTEQNDSQPLPQMFDWRLYDKVTPVKNQGSCGSCWAFATIATIESAFLIKLNESFDLSEQQLVDCCNQNNRYMCFGCGGGWLPQAMKYLEEFGVEYETDYKYAAKNQICLDSPNKAHLKIKGYTQLAKPSTDDDIMRAIYENGPVSVFIDSNGNDFKFYKSGIMQLPGHLSADHYVTAVGWGPDYWIVKNSWGTDWGEQGYFKIAKGMNLRGFNNQIVYPIL